VECDAARVFARWDRGLRHSPGADTISASRCGARGTRRAKRERSTPHVACPWARWPARPTVCARATAACSNCQAVFGGRLSFARSAAFSASKVASRLLNSSIRASNIAITASFSALANEDESGGGIIHIWSHIRAPDATAFTLFASICRTGPYRGA
jgi:hypothetical protein